MGQDNRKKGQVGVITVSQEKGDNSWHEDQISEPEWKMTSRDTLTRIWPSAILGKENGMAKADVQVFDLGKWIENCADCWARECKRRSLFAEEDGEFIWNRVSLRCLCVQIPFGQWSTHVSSTWEKELNFGCKFYSQQHIGCNWNCGQGWNFPENTAYEEGLRYITEGLARGEQRRKKPETEQSGRWEESQESKMSWKPREDLLKEGAGDSIRCCRNHFRGLKKNAHWNWQEEEIKDLEKGSGESRHQITVCESVGPLSHSVTVKERRGIGQQLAEGVGLRQWFFVL